MPKCRHAPALPPKPSLMTAVVLGPLSVVGRHLLRRLAESGTGGLCYSGRDPADPVPDVFTWLSLPSDGELRAPDGSTLYSMAPLTALPAILWRMTGIRRVIALGTSSTAYKGESADPAERELVREFERAERDVSRLCRERGIAWTILRPTLIYDPGRDRNVTTLATIARRFGFVPLAWPARGLRQPIHADDVAQAMLAAAAAPGAVDAAFALPGGETLEYREMVRRIMRATGRWPVLIYLPLGPARFAMALWLRATGDAYSLASLERMNRDLVFDPAPARDILGVSFRPFRPEFTRPADTRGGEGC